MRRHLVIKLKDSATRGAERECAARYVRVAANQRALRKRAYVRGNRETRPSIAQSLPRIGYCFCVHLFMKQDEMQEVRLIISVDRFAASPVIQVTHTREHSTHICKSFCSGRKRQIPSRVVGYASRIIQTVPLTERRLQAAKVPQNPVFLEPCNVTNLPT